MIERWIERVRPFVSGERALAAVREIAQHHRIQASPGYDAAAAWLVAQLAAAGVEHAVERVPADGRTSFLGCVMPEGWSCAHARAHLHGASGRELLADFTVQPLSLVQRSMATEGHWPLVALADGSRESDYANVDVRGRVVLTEGAVQRVHALAVVARGAAGLLAFGRRLVPPARTRETDRDSHAYTSFWWGGDEPRGWGFVASPAVGEALMRRLAGGEALELEVSIGASRHATTIPLVTALLPGTLPGEVLLTAHLCHPRPGANDNGSGVAAVLEAVRALAELDVQGGLPGPRRTIRALWMPEFTGTYAWLGGDPARAGGTVAALNLDMVGENQADCASEQLLERAPHFAGSFADELVRHVRLAARSETDGVLRAREVPYSGGSDHAIWLDPRVGVPCPMLIQWPDRYYHSSLDGPERCDPASLAHAARIGAVYAAFLAHADAPAVAWLGSAIERTTLREMRGALDGDRPAAAVRAARLRGEQALASLSRLLPGGGDGALERTLAAGAEAIDGAFETEIRPGLSPGVRAPLRAVDARVPRRLQAAPLVPMRSLQVGWWSLPPAAREDLHALDRDVPGGSVTLDLAWYACDGRRSVDQIVACLADEGADVAVETLVRFFDLAVALGAAEWVAG